MKYFGTDGIRGKAYEFLTDALAYKVGRSLSVLGLKKMVIGRDTRESGVMLVEAIINGAFSVGIDVIDLGIVSTPLLSFVSGKTEAIGVMVTASHNPYIDNGIKVFFRGKKLFFQEEQALEDALNEITHLKDALQKGKALSPIDTFEMYSGLFQPLRVTSDLRIALDLANGATFAIAPSIFRSIVRNPVLTGNVPNGKNINQDVGSTHIENLLQVVADFDLDYGFAFDGDGDRLIAVDKNQKIYDGDMLLFVIANYLNQRNLLNKSTVVLTKMSNLGIIKAFERQKIEVRLADVGDKFVLEALENEDLTLGGENSGHIINRSLLNTGDGVLNAAYLIKILHETHQTLAELCQDIVFYPDKLVNLKDVDKQLVFHPEVVQVVEDMKNLLGNDGKILVRPSGTEPLIRVSVSAKSEELLTFCQNKIVETILRLNRLKKTT